MANLFVLGSAGMLGRQVVLEAKKRGISVFSLDRNFADFKISSFDEIKARFSRLGADTGDYVANCIGWIPQKASGNLEADTARAVEANVLVPAALSAVCADLGMSVIQIGTDCIFSGEKGLYSEESQPDAMDLYGMTKILGESVSGGFQVVRCSIVGLSSGGSGLIDWLLSQARGAEISGFSNHLWNGVTINAFSKLVCGLVSGEVRTVFRHHWVPADFVSKYELLMMAREISGRTDLIIREVPASLAKDMRLTAIDEAHNAELWRIAGYPSVPYIKNLMVEMFESGEEDYG